MSYYSTAKLLMYRDDFVKMVEKLRADGNLKLARLDTNSHLDLELYRQNGDGDEMVVAYWDFENHFEEAKETIISHIGELKAPYSFVIIGEEGYIDQYGDGDIEYCVYPETKILTEFAPCEYVDTVYTVDKILEREEIENE